MPEVAADLVATRVALLELGEERRMVQEGHELLDEKRVMLAGEILRQLRRYTALREELGARAAAARAALAAAVANQGFEALTVAPAAGLESASLRVESRSFLGIELAEAALEVREVSTQAAVQASPLLPAPELRACALAFHSLIAGHVGLAALAGNLRRLRREYVRTERRARALENVVLPEIDASLRFVGEQLDALDLEEALRVRNAAGAARA